MKIPIQLSFKYFDENVLVKKKVDSMEMCEVMDMYKSIMVPIFGERAYEETIINLSERIKRHRKKEPFILKVYRWFNNIFKD